MIIASIEGANPAGPFTRALAVYRRLHEVWTYQQRLDAPFVSEYSGFGPALSVQGETLGVSAPGYLNGPVRGTTPV